MERVPSVEWLRADRDVFRSVIFTDGRRLGLSHQELSWTRYELTANESTALDALAIAHPGMEVHLETKVDSATGEAAYRYYCGDTFLSHHFHCPTTWPSPTLRVERRGAL